MHRSTEKQDIKVESVGRAFPFSSLPARKDSLERHSTYIGQVLRADLIANNVVYHPERGAIRITDNCKEYDNKRTFNHFSADVMGRFILFTEDENIQYRQQLLQAEILRNESICKKRLDTGMALAHGEYEREKAVLDERKEEDLKQVQEALEAAMEASLQAIRKSHEKALALEKAKIQVC